MKRTMNEELAAWEQQPGESSKAFHAFTHYRDLGSHERSIEVAYSVHKNACLKPHQSSTTAVPSQWKVWSSRNDWVSRATEHDRHLDSLLLQELEQLRVEARRRWLDMGRGLQSRAYGALSSMDLEGVPIRELRMMVRDGVRIEQDALGPEPESRGDDAQERIRAFLEAVSPSPAEVAALFADVPAAAEDDGEGDDDDNG